MQLSTELRETSLRSPSLHKDGEKTDGQAHRKAWAGSSTRCAAVDATRMRWVPAEGPKGEKYIKPESSVLAANSWCINSRHVESLSVCLWVWWGGLHLAGVCGSGCGEGLHLSSSLCLCWADSGWRPPSFSMTPDGDPGWTPPTSHISSLVFRGHRGEAGMPRIGLQPVINRCQLVYY